MFTITKRYFVWFACSSMLLALLCLPAAFAQYDAAEQVVADRQPTPPTVIPVSMSASLPVPVPVPMRALAPAVNPKPVLPGSVQEHEREKLMITQMNGEVHFKHLQDRRMDPARALYIETGNTAQSFCECRMRECTARAWKDTQLSVFPDSGVLYLNKGALIVKVARNPEAIYTVIAGDLMCRVPAGTLRVQRSDRFVSFQVLEGTLTVYNRQTGQVSSVSQQFNSQGTQQIVQPTQAPH